MVAIIDIDMEIQIGERVGQWSRGHGDMTMVDMDMVDMDMVYMDMVDMDMVDMDMVDMDMVDMDMDMVHMDMVPPSWPSYLTYRPELLPELLI